MEDDIFKDLRENFFNFWKENFGKENLLKLEKRCQENESKCDNADKPLGQSTSGVSMNDEKHVLGDALKIRSIVSTIDSKDKSDFESVIDKLDVLSEKLQMFKIGISSTNVMPKPIKDVINLLAYDMFNVVVHEKSRCKVQWCAHLLHQAKLVEVETSNSYLKLLQMFDDMWDKIVKPSYNEEKRYIWKLMGFVCHIDGRESEEKKEFAKAPMDFKDAGYLYEKATTWKNEGFKKTIIDDIHKFDNRFSKIECSEGDIGPRGGILSKADCKIEVPEGQVIDNVHIKMGATAKNPGLPDDLYPVSPTMSCQIDKSVKKALVTLPSFCTTEDPNSEVILLNKRDDEDKWRNVASQPFQGHKEKFEFWTSLTQTKFVMAIKNILTAKYILNSEVWYSKDGNFSMVFIVKNKLVKDSWEKKMKESGFMLSQARINPIEVKGTDTVSVLLEVLDSEVVVFDPSKPESFNVKNNIAKTNQEHYVEFRLKVLPVGKEIIVIRCAMKTDGKMLTKKWNLIWPDLSEKEIKNTFRSEVIPSFDFREGVRRWSNFATHGLLLSAREQNQAVDPNQPLRQQWENLLSLWLHKTKNSGEQRLENAELQTRIRQLVVKYREPSK